MAEKKLINWVSIICQAIGTVVILGGIVAYPLKIKFGYVEAKQCEIDNRITKCEEKYNRLKDDMPSMDLINAHLKNINEKMDTLIFQIKNCQENEKKFIEKFYDYISK